MNGNGNGTFAGDGPRSAPFVTFQESDNNLPGAPLSSEAMGAFGGMFTFGSTPEPAPNQQVYELPPITVTGEQTNYWLLAVVLLALFALSRQRRA